MAEFSYTTTASVA